MSNTVTITVPDRAEQARSWGKGGGCLVLRTLEIPTHTPQGERRINFRTHRFHEDGDWFVVTNWELDSGRVEKYAEVIDLYGNQ